MMNRKHTKVIAGLILAAAVATTMAPAAEAARYRGSERSKPVHANRARYRTPPQVRYRTPPQVRYVRPYPQRVVRYYHRHDSHEGLAFLGGLLLGAVISNAAHADHYFYADPYCDLRFSTLAAYRAHLRYHHHPAIVHVIEIRTGDWVDSYAWRHDGWRHYESDRWECGWDD